MSEEKYTSKKNYGIENNIKKKMYELWEKTNTKLDKIEDMKDSDLPNILWLFGIPSGVVFNLLTIEFPIMYYKIISKIDKHPEINEKLGEIAQSKANLFNEVFSKNDLRIDIPSTIGELKYTINDKYMFYDVENTAISQLQESVKSIISEKANINYGKSGELLLNPIESDSKYLVSDLQDFFNTELLQSKIDECINPLLSSIVTQQDIEFTQNALNTCVFTGFFDSSVLLIAYYTFLKYSEKRHTKKANKLKDDYFIKYGERIEYYK